MKLMDKIWANIYCRNIDNCKLHKLEAVGDMEIAYWTYEEEKWQKKLNELIIED